MSSIQGKKEQYLREIDALGGRFRAYLGLEYRQEMLEENLASLDRIRKLKMEIDQLSAA